MGDQIILTLAILGGTGNEGKGLALRWAKAGYQVIIGSRTTEKAERISSELNEKLGENLILGLVNDEAAAKCDIAVLTVPYSAHKATLEGLKDRLAGKILVDVTVPLVPPKVTKVQMPAAGSAALEAQQILGDDVCVVAAFQNISHAHLQADHDIPCDVLVCGKGRAAREQVLQLVEAAGLIGWDAGPIENSVVVEGMTSILIGLNKKHGVTGAGIKITGIPPASQV